MFRIGNYTATKTRDGYVVTDQSGEAVGTYPTARAATDATVAAIAAAYRAAK